MSDETAEPNEAPRTLESVAFGWWRGLEERRADRAVMRRCATTADVAFAAPFHRLLSRLREGKVPVVRTEWLAAAAGALAHVEQPLQARSLAEALGSPRGEASPMSGLRFRRLLRVDDPDELLVALIRAVRMLDRKAPVASLAADAFWWGEAVKKRWAFDYYEAAPEKEP